MSTSELDQSAVGENGGEQGTKTPVDLKSDKSQEITMFSPYVSFKNSDQLSQGSNESQQREVVTLRETDNSKPGSAKVIFNKIRSSFISQPAPVPPSQKTSSKQGNIRDMVPTPHTVRSETASDHASSDATQSRTHTVDTGEQKGKVLVNPARGGINRNLKPIPTMEATKDNFPPSPQKTKPTTVAVSPAKQSQLEAARWSNTNDGVSFSGADVQLSLSSYAQPRHPVGSGQNRSGINSQQDGNKTQVLKRFGETNKEQEISSDLKKYWMPDKACKECSDCGIKFSLFTRRHHCRMCGRIFCNTCCSLTIPGALLRPDLLGNVRVCKNCRTLFREFHASKPIVDPSPLRNTEPQGPDTSPISSRQPLTMTPTKSPCDPLTQSCLPGNSVDVAMNRSESGTYNRVMGTPRPVGVLTPHKSWDDASGRSQELKEHSPSRGNMLEFDIPSYRSKRMGGISNLTGFDSLTVGQREETLLDLDQDEVEFMMNEVWLKLIAPQNGLPRQNHRYRLRTFPNTYSAHSLVEWLVLNGHVRSREVALLVGQAMVDTKRLKIVSSLDSEFRDDTNQFLELGAAAELDQEQLEGPPVADAPKWFQRLRDNGDDMDDPKKQLTVGDKELMYIPSVNQSTGQNTELEISSVNLKGIKKRRSRLDFSQSSNSLARHEKDDDYILIDHKSAKLEPSKEEILSESDELSKSGSGQSVTHSGLLGSTDLRNIVASSHRPNSFSVINSEDLVHALPVEGLSSATDAAEEFAKERSKISVSSEKAQEHFEQEYLSHFNSMMVQLMMSVGLDLVWLDVIKPLIIEASRTVRTDNFSDDMMDINQYVKIKKIQRGKKSFCSLIYGVVCTKNVTHKKMYKSIKNPKILFLKCAFDFQRKESQLSSFDTLQLQEEKYLKNLVVKVNTIKPNLILVQKSVSRLALEMLYSLGIVVVLNVKPSVMMRVARSTNGQILHSLDQLFFGNSSIFGTCGHFYIRNFSLPDGDKKTLMYFDQCPPSLGCVITLQGGSMKELKKVKRVTQFGLHIAYNALLETNFLVDEFAWPRSTLNILQPHPYFKDYSPNCLTPEMDLFPSLGYPLDILSHDELQKKLEALQFFQMAENEFEVMTGTANEKKNISEPLVEGNKGLSKDEKEKGLRKDELTEASGELNDITCKDESVFSLEGESEKIPDLKPVIERDTKEDTLNETQPSALLSRDVSGLLMTVPEIGTVSRQLPVMTDDLLNKLAEKEFKLAHQNHIVSISPNVHFKAPYLQTPKGRAADTRQYLPKIVYWSYLFKPMSLLKQSQRQGCTPEALDLPGLMEMGLSKSILDGVVGVETEPDNESGIGMEYESSKVISPLPSYKSITTHPFTSSIFLLQANTNEMKAALADFRCRAGYDNEDNNFMFRAARRASNYQMHLNNVFQESEQFELAAAALEETTALSKSEKKVSSIEVEAKKKWWEKKLNQSSDLTNTKHKQMKQIREDPFARLMPGKMFEDDMESVPDQPVDHTDGTSSVVSESTPPASDDHMGVDKNGGLGLESGAVCMSNKEQTGSDLNSGTVHSNNTQLVSHNIIVVSTDEGGVTKDIVKPNESEIDEDLGLVEALHPMRSGSIHKSNGMKISEKFATLNDFDHSRKSKGESEENLDNMGLNYDTWLAADEQVDCFDPSNHQGISILFSNTAHDGQKHQLPCVPPSVIPMFYYGRNDISLGEFLQRYCFRPFYRCQTCSGDMVEHQRHVVHASSAIHISMQQLEAALPGDDNAIYTWLACKYCDQCTPYTQMSKNGLLFSFAKFLELKFHCSFFATRHNNADNSSTCQHCLHKDYVQYFCHKNKIAAFKPSEVELLEVLLPPRTIVIRTPRYQYHVDFKGEIKHTQRIMEGVFYQICQKLEKYRMDPVAGTIDDHIANCKAERDAMRKKVKYLKDVLVSGKIPFTGEVNVTTLNTSADLELEETIISNLQEGIADFKRCLTDVVDCWNIHLEDLDARIREYRGKLRERDSVQSDTTRDSSVPSSSTTPSTPATITRAMSTSCHSIPDTDKGSETYVPHSTATPSDHTPSTTSESIDSEHIQNSSGNQQEVLSVAENSQQEKAHSRQRSEGSILQTSGEKEHKRQFSDSAAHHLAVEVSEIALRKSGFCSSETAFSSQDVLSGSPITSSPYPDDLVGKEFEAVPDDPAVANDMNSDEEIAEDKENSDGHVTQREADEDPTPHQPHPQDVTMGTEKDVKSGGQKEREGDNQADSSGGILSRLRGKEQPEFTDDPNRYYILDPYFTTKNSPPIPRSSSSAHTNKGHQDALVKPVNKRQDKKRVVHTQGGGADGHTEGLKNSEKRGTREREKTGVLSRPFHRLPHPFPSNEHHSMHSIINHPIGIYDKEPTSIIAFALSSHEYARKLAVFKERCAVKVGGASAKPVEVKSGPSVSPTVRLKRQPSETEKLPSGSSGTTLKTNFKAVLNELKKKGSAISLFSGSTSVSTTVSSTEAVDPFVDTSRRTDFSTSYLSKSQEGDNALSARPNDPLPEGTGIPPTVGSVAVPDEIDTGKLTPHISLEFVSPDKLASFFCKVYYAEEFRELRELIFPSGEERFIRSLARCIKYDAKGGKSRSAFCKVADDRFIMKQVKSIEISSFELFAPHYLQHVTKALEEKRPLTFAKILGVYSIGFRNTKTGNSKRLDVLVMENLLYGHNTSKVYDLKGSMRSRYIDPSKDSSGDVLLDENYLNFICYDPVYVHPHSKSVLMQAILADTEFLAHNGIMDYSLLTCIDETTGELVVGIIDYVRTFTLDKRLEMYLKKTAGKGLPTILAPELYRKRFYDAMDRYFSVVPDKWTGLGADVKFL